MNEQYDTFENNKNNQFEEGLDDGGSVKIENTAPLNQFDTIGEVDVEPSNFKELVDQERIRGVTIKASEHDFASTMTKINTNNQTYSVRQSNRPLSAVQNSNTLLAQKPPLSYREAHEDKNLLAMRESAKRAQEEKTNQKIEETVLKLEDLEKQIKENKDIQNMVPFQIKEEIQKTQNEITI